MAEYEMSGVPMCVSIGARVQSMIDHMDRGELSLALSDICIALDATAQKYYGKNLSGRGIYKDFVHENIWMIVITGMGNLVSEDIKIPFQHKDIKADDNGYCTLEEIVYHIMRCGLVHGTGEDSKIVWNKAVSLALDKNGILNISPTFIWGLALAVITCDVNKDERVNDTCWISTMTFKYLINDLWGRRESIKTMLKSAYAIDIGNKEQENA